MKNRLHKEAYELQDELQEENIEQYLKALLPELNLRLWLDTEAMKNEEIMGKMLWVESITLTSYTPCKASKISHRMGWRIFNRLMGRRT